MGHGDTGRSLRPRAESRTSSQLCWQSTRLGGVAASKHRRSYAIWPHQVYNSRRLQTASTAVYCTCCIANNSWRPAVTQVLCTSAALCMRWRNTRPQLRSTSQVQNTALASTFLSGSHRWTRSTPKVNDAPSVANRHPMATSFVHPSHTQLLLLLLLLLLLMWADDRRRSSDRLRLRPPAMSSAGVGSCVTTPEIQRYCGPRRTWQAKSQVGSLMSTRRSHWNVRINP